MILLIDDDETLLERISSDIGESHPNLEIRSWVPTKDDDAQARFQAEVSGDEVDLVVTDSDLTSKGQTGLFGATIVDWCQERGLPVADYTRKVHGLPRRPDLFELRLEINAETHLQIAALASGFGAIKTAIAEAQLLEDNGSPAAVLAAILQRPEIESEIALYSVRIGPTSGAMMERLSEALSEDVSHERKTGLLSYIVGHWLVNSILRFPGPILSLAALNAYLATDEGASTDVAGLIEPARYRGPFSELDTFYWTDDIDALVDELPDPGVDGSPAEVRRSALEARLGRGLTKHGCRRCSGVRGGYYCPFTERTVCEQSSCSVGTSSWIPQGASVVRVERDFFDEWSPILGL